MDEKREGGRRKEGNNKYPNSGRNRQGILIRHLEV
jgi:hypothetical protein